MSDDAQKEPIVQASDEVHEAMRLVCRSSPGQTIPAPTAYEVLGNLQASGYLQVQALRQLTQGLQRSLSDPRLDVRQDDGSDPALTVSRAGHLPEQSASLASDLADLLAAAQEELSTQSFSTK